MLIHGRVLSDPFHYNTLHIYTPVRVKPFSTRLSPHCHLPLPIKQVKLSRHCAVSRNHQIANSRLSQSISLLGGKAEVNISIDNAAAAILTLGSRRSLHLRGATLIPTRPGCQTKG